MVHMSYVPLTGPGPESTRKYRSDVPAEKWFGNWCAARDTGKGSALGPRTWGIRTRLGRRDERGAEMVEFAFVVVLLIALLYGIISYGLVLAAQSTITQAAADGARAGIVASSIGAATAAENQASTDIGWMGKGSYSLWSFGTTGRDHMRRDARTVSFERHQHLSQCDGHLQLRLLATVPRAARLRRHHAVEPLVDKRPPALDPDFVGAPRVEHSGGLLGAHRDDERGAVLVFTAMCMIVLLWAGAMGIDVGFSV